MFYLCVRDPFGVFVKRIKTVKELTELHTAGHEIGPRSWEAQRQLSEALAKRQRVIDGEEFDPAPKGKRRIVLYVECEEAERLEAAAANAAQSLSSWGRRVLLEAISKDAADE